MADPQFFFPARRLSLAEIASLAGGRLERGDPAFVLSRVAPLDQAGPGDLTFLDNPRYVPHLRATTAAAVILADKHLSAVPEGTAAIVAPSPYRGMALVLQALFPDAARPPGVTGESGLSPAAHIHADAVVEEGATVEAGAVIGRGAEVGRGTVICANAVIGAGVRIGRDGYVGPNASVTHALVGNRVILHAGVRIGQDGFGFAMGPTGHLKVPQIGRVVIQDDVEVGANTTIDRGSNRDTIVGEGTKIDNGVQIGHNVVVGRHCVLVSQTGVAGSSTLGDFVALGGQAGVSGHVKVGSGAQVAGASAVKDDIPAGMRVAGIPAKPLREFIREMAVLQKLASGRENQS